MITPIKDILEIDKIIRNTIIEESEFEANRVLNAISVRGQNLSKLVEDNIYMSYDLDDLIIIFEVIPNPSFNDNVTMEEDDGSITNYSNFYVKIIIYGTKSANVAYKLKSRLLSRRVKDDLCDKGIHINSVSSPEPTTEWLNETLWVRNDLTMIISCRESFKKTTPDYDIKELGELYIKEIEE